MAQETSELRRRPPYSMVLLRGYYYLEERNYRITIYNDIVIKQMKIKGNLILGWYNYSRQKKRQIYRMCFLVLGLLMVMQFCAS